MTRRRRTPKPRRKAARVRRAMIKDYRGLPARRVPEHRVAKLLGLILYSVQRTGVCVITKGARPSAVLLRPDDPRVSRAYAIADVAAARRRDPGGTFTVADRVFGSSQSTDRWMIQPVLSLGNIRPVNLLDTEGGILSVLDALNSIEHGQFG
jgi:hypothetical protein